MLRGLLLAMCWVTWATRLTGEERDTSPPRSFVYKKTEQTDLQMAVHYPPHWRSTDRRAAIVFFFGGGWTTGDIEQFSPQAAAMAERGMVAMRADYRVKSRHGVTPRECVADAKSAVRWIRAHATQLGIDPDRIVAAGGSAGGHLAACTALTPGLDAAGDDLQVSSRPNALVLFNPVLRFADVPKLMARIDDNEELGKAISPVLHLAKDSPPAIVFFGSADALAPQGEEFVKRSREVGCRVELSMTEGQTHGFFNRSPWREKTTQAMDAFLVSLGYLPPQDAHADRLDQDWLAALQVTTSKAEDRVEARIESDTLTLHIFSPSGIGRATITSPQGIWPVQTRLHMHLTGLEHVEIATDTRRLSGEFSSHGAVPALVRADENGAAGNRVLESPITARNATGQLVAELPGKDGYFEICLPREMLADQPKSLEVHWIDFYRE